MYESPVPSRMLDRPPPATTVESIFGWNRPFDRESVDSEIFYLLEDAEALEGESGKYKSKVRFDLRPLRLPHR
jgi:hypothetical protein